MTNIEFTFQVNNDKFVKSGNIFTIYDEKNISEDLIINYLLLCLRIYHNNNLLPKINKYDIIIHQIYYESEKNSYEEINYDFFLNLDYQYFIFNKEKTNIILSRL